MTVPSKEAPANSVPAAAVIQRVQALFGITGRKARAGGSSKSEVKSHCSTVRLLLILPIWRPVEAGRIAGVAVECVEICKNTRGEGGQLGRF